VSGVITVSFLDRGAVETRSVAPDVLVPALVAFFGDA
jgi:hypothetical protein